MTRRIALLAALLLAPQLAAAAPWTKPGVGMVKLTQGLTYAFTETSPADEGATLVGTLGLEVTVEADAGQTLSGGGSLLAWRYDPALAHWSRAPDLDLVVPPGVAGRRSVTFLAFQVIGRSTGRIVFATSAVTVSAGSASVWIRSAPSGSP